MTGNPFPTEGNYISFVLGREEYAVPFAKVHEILDPEGIQEFIDGEPCLKGVMNLRNQKVPVLDLKCRFQVTGELTKNKGAVLVTGCGPEAKRMGILVDSIRQVLHIDPKILQPSVVEAGDPRADYIVGIAKIQGRVISLLDFDKGLDLLGSPEGAKK